MENGLAIAWGWYLGSLALALLVLWRMGRVFSLPLRLALVLIPLVVFAVPWSVGPEHSELAPAWMVAVFDGLGVQELSFWRAGWVLIPALLLPLIPVWLVAHYRRKREAVDG